jgi:hypothetical protein
MLRWSRSHAHGWVAEIEAPKPDTDRWDAYAHPLDRDRRSFSSRSNIRGEAYAKEMADTLVQIEMPHACDACGPWRSHPSERAAAVDRREDDEPAVPI